MRLHWLGLFSAPEFSRGRPNIQRIIARRRAEKCERDSTLLFSWQLSNAARPHGFAAFRAGDGGKAQREARKIVPRAIRGLALLGNCRQQLGHRAVEPVWEPRALQPRAGETLRSRHLDSLEMRAWSSAAYCAGVADYQRAVEVVEPRKPVEDERHLRRLVLDNCLREEGR